VIASCSQDPRQLVGLPQDSGSGITKYAEGAGRNLRVEGAMAIEA
jgi:hypothetical protein